MRILLSLLSLLLLSSVASTAQTLSGRVLDSEGNPLCGANVIAWSGENAPSGYAVADKDGLFSLDVPKGADHVTVTFIGFKTLIVRMDELAPSHTIVLEEQAFSLREVAVTPENISETGDTLTYSVAGFKEVQDRSIADVISKMPGLEVKSDGAIEYQGKAIGSFYIEGLDLMEGQYSLASSNIQADKVESVQVLENHQRVRSLRGVDFSEQAALNIVLKDDAKAVWTGHADLGAGYAGAGEGVVYDNRIMGMQFSKKFQTLMMYKNNNTGIDISTEVQDISDLGGYQAESGLISMPELGGPSFDEKRYSFNASHLFAANMLWKTGRNSDIRMQLSGFHDKERLRSESSTTYLSIDGMPVVTEDYDITSKKNEIKGEVCYTLNSDRTYLRSNTKVYADWNSGNGEMLYNGRGTDLMVRPYKRVFSEDLNLSHTTARGDVWQVTSSTGDTYLPGQILTIDGVTRLLDINMFSTRNSASFNRKIRTHFFKNAVGFDYRRQKINGVTWQLSQPYWEPSVQLTFGSHRLTGSVKTSYAYQTYDGESFGRIWIEPSLSWKWKASPKSELSFSYRRPAMPHGGTKVIDTPVYTSYRSLYEGTGHLGRQSSDILSAGYTYRNPVSGIFFNLRPMYVRASDNILYESTMESDIHVQKATDRTYDSDIYIVGSRLAKSFPWCRTRIGINGSFNSTGYAYLLGETVREARVNVYSVSLDYSIKPFRWWNVEGQSGMKASSRNNAGQVTDWSHYLDFHFSPVSGWMISLDNELYHSNDRGFGLNYFCDISLGYKADRWEISLLANNVIGTSEYKHVTVSATLQAYTLTYLRPREMMLKFSFDF